MPRRRIITTCVAAIVLVLSAADGLRAQQRPELAAQRTMAPPVLDGVLDDAMWQGAAMSLGDWVSYSPLRGDRGDLRTDVRIGYDDRYVYFAFHCFDPEPDKIRTTISRRDTAFADDWIAISLDSAGTGQTAYHLFVNPSGVQMDAINTSSSGEQFEADLLWDSVGKVTSDGYVVELRLPLQSIRFSGGDQVRMGIIFFRKVSRTGVSYSWPAMPPGEWVFENHAGLDFQNLKPRRLLEFLPSLTYGVRQTRATRDRWNPADQNAQLGLSVKHGITSNITVDATVNPDFSQVESDAFQVQVNQRFPIFYSEKRPFFMEGMGLFNVAGSGENLRTAVHTRRIIDPSWGAKLTGTAGKVTFGVLNASDHAPEDVGSRGDAVVGLNKAFTIGRATYALGGSDYVGALVTDTEHAWRHNRVLGADVSLKFSPPQQLTFTVLASQTGLPSRGDTRGTSSQVTYSYNTRRFTSSTQVEHVDRDFQMDTAFFNRTGFTAGWSYGELNFYPREGTNFWLKRVYPFYWTKLGNDEVQRGHEDLLNLGLRFNFTRQGFLQVNRAGGQEAWAGRRFDVGPLFNTFGNVQIVRWLQVSGGFWKSKEIYYDPVNPFSGRVTGGNVGFTLQPNQHLQQNFDYRGLQFDRASDRSHVYTVHIVNTQTTYQFNTHFRLRLLEQFDRSQRRLLTDLLALYEVVPGTVFHAGYGSLYEKPLAGNGAPEFSPFGAGYTTLNRGLFFKASYVQRF